ncbi:MAG: pilus assembly protein PilM [Burkholderiales bacterium]|nr:MAG: pilus assembly protein PilM [Burkholderiales bacterium]
MIEDHRRVADALTRALKLSGARTREAALALPGSAVITKRITLPAGLKEEEYELQVESEASNYIPFPIEEVNLDFQVLGPVANSDDDVEVLLAAARKEKVEDRVAVAEMAGLKPMVMEVEPYAARASVDYVASMMPSKGDGQIVALFDIGQTLTGMTVMLNGQTIFERQQTIGGQQLTQDIRRMYGLTPEEAEVKKRTGDLPENYEHELLMPFLEQTAVELSRALQFFYTSTPYTRVDKVFLAGGSAVLPDLPDVIASRLDVEVGLISPFQGMEIANSVREKHLRRDAPSLLVSCGLAMRRFAA